jgi:hypothetical protein
MRKSLFGIPVFVAALVVIASAAGAGPPAIATGNWDCSTNVIVTIESVRTADGNTITSFSATRCFYTGELTGTFSIHITRIVNSDGSFIDHGYIVCTGCTIGGRTGDFTGALTARSPSPGEVYGVITVVSATGGLTGLHAQAHFERHGPLSSRTYSYRYSFEP